jgi:hypothetical protein
MEFTIQIHKQWEIHHQKYIIYRYIKITINTYIYNYIYINKYIYIEIYIYIDYISSSTYHFWRYHGDGCHPARRRLCDQLEVSKDEFCEGVLQAGSHGSSMPWIGSRELLLV